MSYTGRQMPLKLLIVVQRSILLVPITTSTMASKSILSKQFFALMNSKHSDPTPTFHPYIHTWEITLFTPSFRFSHKWLHLWSLHQCRIVKTWYLPFIPICGITSEIATLYYVVENRWSIAYKKRSSVFFKYGIGYWVTAQLLSALYFILTCSF